jgi:hypothetical protein
MPACLRLAPRSRLALMSPGLKMGAVTALRTPALVRNLARTAPPGGAADSADTDLPDMRGACFAFGGDYVYCLAWFMCVVMSAMEFG